MALAGPEQRGQGRPAGLAGGLRPAHPEGVGAGSERSVGQKCARDRALWLLPWARPSMAQHLDWEGGKGGTVGPVQRAQGSAEEGTHTQARLIGGENPSSARWTAPVECI